MWQHLVELWISVDLFGCVPSVMVSFLVLSSGSVQCVCAWLLAGRSVPAHMSSGSGFVDLAVCLTALAESRLSKAQD